MRFCFVLLWFVNDCGAAEGSTRSIVLILYGFYRGFVKLHFKTFGLFSRVLKQIKVEDFQVFDFALFYRVPGIAEILGIAVDHGPVP